MTEMHWAEASLEKVSRTRPARLHQSPPALLHETEVGILLKQFHPDHVGRERPIGIGVNANGQLFPPEIADLLEADSPLPASYQPVADIETDVLIVGGGGAGTAAALALEASGLTVHLVSKLRLGDSNTVMAEGGIQAALNADDSPRRHFADSYAGGHGKSQPDLLRVLCESGAETIRWLVSLGCLFDRNPDETFRLRKGGGTSVPRVLACRDYTGLEIMRVLRDAFRQGKTHLLERHAAVELLDDGAGQASGAVLWNADTGRLVTVSARAVLLATGGSGQLRLQGFPTSNHVGATGDGLILAYRLGCRLVYMDSFQYHPSGACYPEAVAGRLLTESIRSIGAQLLNADGERFVDEMSYRDVIAAAIIKECKERKGIKTPSGRIGVWLDTPMIELKHGAGTVHRQFPGLIHCFERYGIDPANQPLLVYPTLHYQNGGVEIDTECKATVRGLWAAGEVAGGIHGTNRLMGNSLLDILVFGRRAAQSIIQNLPQRRPVTITALRKYREALKKLSNRPATKFSPQVYPTITGLKVEISMPQNIVPAKDQSTPAATATPKLFDPPDPFGERK